MSSNDQYPRCEGSPKSDAVSPKSSSKDDIVPLEAEFNDPERLKILGTLASLIGEKCPVYTWAYLWLADLEALQMLIDECPHFLLRLVVADRHVDILPRWLSRPCKRAGFAPDVYQKNEPVLSRSIVPFVVDREHGVIMSWFPEDRSNSEIKLCERWDGDSCILTKDREHDVAHIYPWSLRSHGPNTVMSMDNIWGKIQTFWCMDRVKSWQNALYPRVQFADTCYNQMCLSVTAHYYFRNAYFALKPLSLSSDQKKLVVQFFWLPKGNFPKHHTDLVNFLQRPSLAGLDIEGPDHARLWNQITGEPIRSGDEICLETDDPDNRPLPKWELLEMQWFLHRAAAISGAANFEEEVDNDDFDDWGCLQSSDSDTE